MERRALLIAAIGGYSLHRHFSARQDARENRPEGDDGMLTEKQERFCREYLVDRDAGRAYLRAGYTSANPSKGARRLLERAGVRERLSSLMCPAAEAGDDGAEGGSPAGDAGGAEATLQEVVRALARIAFDESEGGAGVRDRLRALELLGKHLGMFDERAERAREAVRIIDDVPIS